MREHVFAALACALAACASSPPIADEAPPRHDAAHPIEALDYPPAAASQAPEGPRDCTGAPLFFWAVERDDDARLASLAPRDALLARTNDLGETAFHRAARGGRLRVLARLLGAPSSAPLPATLAAREAPDRDGLTPLMAAIDAGQEASVGVLIAAGARLDARSSRNGQTPLHLAARHNDRALVLRLVAAPAPPAPTDRPAVPAPIDALDDVGTTPLGLAITVRASDVIPILLAAHADPLAGRTPDLSPIALALSAPDEPLARTLLALAMAGDPRLADLWPVAAELASPAFLEVLHARDPARDLTDVLGVATAHRRLDNVRWLLAAGADPRRPTADGTLPLHRALLAGASDVARALLDAAPDEARPYHGVPLVGLARRGNVDPDLVTRLSPPGDPMTLAWLGDTDGLRKALAKNPRLVDTLGVEGLSLLHHAARRGQLAVVRLLLGAHASTRTLTTTLGPYPGGDTPLVMALRAGSEPVTELLLQDAVPSDLQRDEDRLAHALDAHPKDLADALWQLFVTRGLLSPRVRLIIGNPLEDPHQKTKGLDAKGQGAWATERGTGIQLVERASELDVLLPASLGEGDPGLDRDNSRDLVLARCLDQGGLLEARRLAEDARAARRAPIDRDRRRLADHNLGRVLARMGAFADARTAYERALEAWPDADRALADSTAPTASDRAVTPLWHVVATMLEHRGELALAVGALADAARDFQAAIPLRKPSGPTYRGRPASLLALVETARGAWKQALALLAGVAAQRREDLGPNAAPTLAVRNNQAVLFDALGDRAAAAQIFEEQLGLFERTTAGDDLVAFAAAEVNVARIRLDQGKTDVADALLRSARAHLVAADPLTHPLLGQVDLERGRVLSALGRTDDARAAFEAALRELEAAHGHRHGLVARAELRLAELALARGDERSARSLLLDAWTIAQGAPEESWPIELALGRLEASGQHLASAILFGKRAVATLEAMRTALAGLGALEHTFVEGRIGAWRQLADWLVAAGRLGEATRVMELVKYDEVASLELPVTRAKTSTRSATKGTPSESEAPPPPPPSLAPSERAASEHLAIVSADLAAAGSAVQAMLAKQAANGLDDTDAKRLRELRLRLREGRLAFERALAAIEAEFATLSPARLADIAAMNLRDITSLQGTLGDLGHGAVLVHYVASPTELHIILTTPAIQVARTASIHLTDLRTLVFGFRSALADPHSDPRPLAQSLYNLLIAPIAADLEAAHAETLMFALDGVLRYIPMAALHDGQSWFIERHRVVLFSRASIDKLLIVPGATRVAALGVGIQFPGFAQLTEVPRECEGIVKRDPADPDGVVPGVVALDAAFSRERFSELLDTKVFSSIHLASHFVFEPGKESDSYLLLGNGDHLTLEDLKLDFRFDGVDLLTLSACNTAVGDDSPASPREGRELEGFAALTQRLGARAVIATLWSVADQSTADFMRALYQLRQAAPDLGKAEAMRQAALQMIRGTDQLPPSDLHPRGGFHALVPNPSTPPDPATPTNTKTTRAHPFYWAPFVLIGNWR